MRKKLAFLVSNIKQLVRYYSKTILTGTVAAILTIIAVFIKDFLPSNDNIKTIYLIFRYGPWVLFIILLFISLIDIFIYKLSGSGFTINRWILDGYYYNDKRYTLTQRISCHNESKQPISDLLEVREGYHEKPKSPITCQIKPTHKSENYQIMISSGPAEIKKSFNTVNRVHNVYIYKWFAHVSPPIRADEDFEYSIRISTQDQEVEKNAFESSGTLFSWIVPVRTREMMFTIHPPCGCVVNLIDYSVEDENGQTLQKEKKLISPPKILSAGTILSWYILFPKTNVRYGVRYFLKQF